jgi:putative FmdB family regulatory protein
MPIYPYRCNECETEFELLASMKDSESEKAAKVPTCCGATMARVFLPAMVQVPGGINICYQSPIDGTPIQTMRKRRYDMEKSGSADARDYVDSWEKTYKKREDDRADAKKYYDSIPDSAKIAAMALA